MMHTAPLGVREDVGRVFRHRPSCSSHDYPLSLRSRLGISGRPGRPRLWKGAGDGAPGLPPAQVAARRGGLA